MKTFIAKSINSGNLELFDELENSLGKIIYPNWYSSNAEIMLNSKVFKVTAKGFWTTSFVISEYEKTVMKFTMDWSGKILLTVLSEDEKHYRIEKEKWYNDVFVVKNENDRVSLKIKRNFKWKGLKDFYELILEDDEIKPMTMLGILYVVNYFISSSDTAAYS